MDITITKVVDESKGEHTWKTIYYNDAGKEHKKAIFLKDKYDLLFPGAYIDIVLTQNGIREYQGKLVKNWEVTDIKPLSEKQPVQTDNGAYAAQDMRNRSISRQSARRDAVMSYQGTIAPTCDILSRAEDFYTWETTGSIPIHDIDESKKVLKK